MKSVVLPEAASTWSIGDMSDQPVHHSCALAELINASVLISGSPLREVATVESHISEQYLRSAIVERAVLERAPKASPPQA